VADGTETLASAAGATLDQLRVQAERRPYVVVLVAGAAGYLLAGGIPGWAVRAASNMAGRVLVARALAAMTNLE